MNLATDPEAVIRALTEVEGERWLERQKKGDFKGSSIFDAIEELKKSWKPEGPHREHSLSTVVYGADGWNRYGVLESGEVYFVERQAWGREAVEKARKAGFRIW